ncbi:MAG: hypothetical protein HY391_05605 [Deltaproteobacteria bacterium]|nr:hypothetical protein [Deltaproteobacteria bacterium]
MKRTMLLLAGLLCTLPSSVLAETVRFVTVRNTAGAVSYYHIVRIKPVWEERAIPESRDEEWVGVRVGPDREWPRYVTAKKATFTVKRRLGEEHPISVSATLDGLPVDARNFEWQKHTKEVKPEGTILDDECGTNVAESDPTVVKPWPRVWIDKLCLASAWLSDESE